MSVKFLLSLVFFLMTCSWAFALESVGYGQIRLCPGGCEESTATDPTDYVFNPSETGAACIAQSSYVVGSVKVYQIYCSGGIAEYENAAAVMQNIVGVPVGSETDAARQAFNSWSDGVVSPACSPEHLDGGVGEGYIFSTSPNTDPTMSNINLNMWKRRHCESTAGGSLAPIGTIGGGSGGGSTDMTATNALLTSIQSNTAGLVSPGAIDVNVVSGGGGGSTNMAPTNDLISTGNTSLAGIKDALTGESTLPAVGDPPVVERYKSEYLLDHPPLAAEYKAEFDSFKTDMQATDLYSLMNSFFHPNQGGGSSLYSFNAGQFGNHSYDFSSWGGVMSLLRGLTLVAFSATSMRVIFLKG